MFSALGIYSDRFEKPFLDATQAFYTKESEQFLAENEIAEYLRHVETRLAQENERVHYYLEPSTKKQVPRTP